MGMMFVEFIRNNKVVAGVIAFIRVYLGYTWLVAGWGKAMGGFDASGFIQGAIASAGGENPAVQGWWAAFLEAVALPNADLFSFVVGVPGMGYNLVVKVHYRLGSRNC